MSDKKVKSLKIVFTDDKVYDFYTETGLNKGEMHDYINRVFGLGLAEPLIEDDKKRKVIRDWAEMNGIKVVLVCETFNAWGVKNIAKGEPGDKEYMLADILFRGEKPEKLEFGKEYTIPELCGKEEYSSARELAENLCKVLDKERRKNEN